MAELVAATPKETTPPRRIRRFFLLLTVLVLFVAVLSTAAVAGFYLTTRRPVNELPAVELVTKAIPPRRLFSFVAAQPIGVAVSPDGQQIYVAEGGGDRLIKAFDRQGQLLGQAAPPDSKPGTRKPSLLSVDAEGRLYVTDRLRASVYTYDANLQWQGDWSPSLATQMGGWLPNGVSVGLDGRIYVTEIGQDEHSVLVFTPDGSLLARLAKSSGVPGGLNYPVQAVADTQGRVYVSDGLTARLLAASPTGVRALDSVDAGAIGLPLGLATDGGKLFVADASQHRILVYAVGDSPQYLHSFGDTDDNEGLTYPGAVAVDRSGRIYVADRVNDRVQVWSY